MTGKQQDTLLQNLSAYLDGQLNPSEQDRLEALLQTHPEIQQQLIALDQTRRLLRQAPRLKVPRNFTVSEAMLPQKRGFNLWIPLMSASSALAAIALVITYLFNFSPASAPAQLMDRMTAAQLQAESMTLQAEQKQAPSQEQPVIIQWFGNQFADGKGGGMGGGPAVQAPSAEIMAQEAPLAEAPQADVFTEEAVPLAESQAAEATQTMPVEPSSEMTADNRTQEMPSAAAGAPQATPMPMAEAAAPSESSNQIILGIPPADERGKVIEQTAPSGYEPMALQHTNPAADQQSLQLIRLGLLACSLISAALAVYFSRQQHP